MENNNELIAYAIVENIYIKQMKRKEEYKDLKDEEVAFRLFPSHWHMSSNYMEKMKILKKAIDSDTNINNLPEKNLFEEVIQDKRI